MPSTSESVPYIPQLRGASVLHNVSPQAYNQFKIPKTMQIQRYNMQGTTLTSYLSDRFEPMVTTHQLADGISGNIRFPLVAQPARTPVVQSTRAPRQPQPLVARPPILLADIPLSQMSPRTAPVTSLSKSPAQSNSPATQAVTGVSVSSVQNTTSSQSTEHQKVPQTAPRMSVTAVTNIPVHFSENCERNAMQGSYIDNRRTFQTSPRLNSTEGDGINQEHPHPIMTLAKTPETTTVNICRSPAYQGYMNQSPLDILSSIASKEHQKIQALRRSSSSSTDSNTEELSEDPSSTSVTVHPVQVTSKFMGSSPPFDLRMTTAPQSECHKVPNGSPKPGDVTWNSNTSHVPMTSFTSTVQTKGIWHPEVPSPRRLPSPDTPQQQQSRTSPGQISTVGSPASALNLTYSSSSNLSQTPVSRTEHAGVRPGSVQRDKVHSVHCQMHSAQRGNSPLQNSAPLKDTSRSSTLAKLSEPTNTSNEGTGKPTVVLVPTVYSPSQILIPVPNITGPVGVRFAQSSRQVPTPPKELAGAMASPQTFQLVQQTPNAPTFSQAKNVQEDHIVACSSSSSTNDVSRLSDTNVSNATCIPNQFVTAVSTTPQQNMTELRARLSFIGPVTSSTLKPTPKSPTPVSKTTTNTCDIAPHTQPTVGTSPQHQHSHQSAPPSRHSSASSQDTPTADTHRGMFSYKRTKKFTDIECRKCGYKCRYSREWKTHVRQAHWDLVDKFICKECIEHFNTKDEFAHHARFLHAKSFPKKLLPEKCLQPLIESLRKYMNTDTHEGVNVLQIGADSSKNTETDNVHRNSAENVPANTLDANISQVPLTGVSSHSHPDSSVLRGTSSSADISPSTEVCSQTIKSVNTSLGSGVPTSTVDSTRDTHQLKPFDTPGVSQDIQRSPSNRVPNPDYCEPLNRPTSSPQRNAASDNPLIAPSVEACVESELDSCISEEMTEVKSVGDPIESTGNLEVTTDSTIEPKVEGVQYPDEQLSYHTTSSYDEMYCDTSKIVKKEPEDECDQENDAASTISYAATPNRLEDVGVFPDKELKPTDELRNLTSSLVTVMSDKGPCNSVNTTIENHGESKNHGKPIDEKQQMTECAPTSFAHPLFPETTGSVSTDVVSDSEEESESPSSLHAEMLSPPSPLYFEVGNSTTKLDIRPRLVNLGKLKRPRGSRIRNRNTRNPGPRYQHFSKHFQKPKKNRPKHIFRPLEVENSPTLPDLVSADDPFWHRTSTNNTNEDGKIPLKGASKTNSLKNQPRVIGSIIPSSNKRVLGDELEEKKHKLEYVAIREAIRQEAVDVAEPNVSQVDVAAQTSGTETYSKIDKLPDQTPGSTVAEDTTKQDGHCVTPCQPQHVLMDVEENFNEAADMLISTSRLENASNKEKVFVADVSTLQEKQLTNENIDGSGLGTEHISNLSNATDEILVSQLNVSPAHVQHEYHQSVIDKENDESIVERRLSPSLSQDLVHRVSGKTSENCLADEEVDLNMTTIEPHLQDEEIVCDTEINHSDDMPTSTCDSGGNSPSGGDRSMPCISSTVQLTPEEYLRLGEETSSNEGSHLSEDPDEVIHQEQIKTHDTSVQQGITDTASQETVIVSDRKDNEIKTDWENMGMKGITPIVRTQKPCIHNVIVDLSKHSFTELVTSRNNPFPQSRKLQKYTSTIPKDMIDSSQVIAEQQTADSTACDQTHNSPNTTTEDSGVDCEELHTSESCKRPHEDDNRPTDQSVDSTSDHKPNKKPKLVKDDALEVISTDLHAADSSFDESLNQHTRPDIALDEDVTDTAQAQVTTEKSVDDDSSQKPIEPHNQVTEIENDADPCVSDKSDSDDSEEAKWGCLLCTYSSTNEEVISHITHKHIAKKHYFCPKCPYNNHEYSFVEHHILGIHKDVTAVVLSKKCTKLKQLVNALCISLPSETKWKNVRAKVEKIEKMSMFIKTKIDFEDHSKYVCHVCCKRIRTQILIRRHVALHWKKELRGSSQTTCKEVSCDDSILLELYDNKKIRTTARRVVESSPDWMHQFDDVYEDHIHSTSPDCSGMNEDHWKTSGSQNRELMIKLSKVPSETGALITPTLGISPTSSPDRKDREVKTVSPKNVPKRKQRKPVPGGRSASNGKTEVRSRSSSPALSISSKSSCLTCSSTLTLPYQRTADPERLTVYQDSYKSFIASDIKLAMRPVVRLMRNLNDI